MGRGRECQSEGCDRGTYSVIGYCQKHKKQFDKYGETWPIGDKAKANEHRRAAWARLSPEERQERIAPMVASIKGKPRSAEHSARLSESIRSRWAEGVSFEDRICRGCEESFTPNSGQHWYCSEDCQAARRRLKGHGLTNRQYLDMRGAQGNVCALCLTPGRGFGSSRFHLVVDHCHDTGKVRGLLCGDCNTALGRFGDDAARLRAAADYIDRTCPH